MPRDNPRDTRFAINFFTSIGLGALTEDLRAHLKNAPKPTAIVAPMVRGAYSSSFMSSLCNQSLFYNPTITPYDISRRDEAKRKRDLISNLIHELNF